jgi:hypothetical protein
MKRDWASPITLSAADTWIWHAVLMFQPGRSENNMIYHPRSENPNDWNCEQQRRL